MYWLTEYVLGGVEGELEVVSSVGGVELAVVERVRSEAVNKRTERHAVIPARREVRYVHVLLTVHTSKDTDTLLGRSAKKYQKKTNLERLDKTCDKSKNFYYRNFSKLGPKADTELPVQWVLCSVKSQLSRWVLISITIMQGSANSRD